MDMQNFEKTTESLTLVAQSLDRLSAVAKNKKNSLWQKHSNYENTVAQKNAQIERFKKVVAQTAEKIGESAQKIDEVIKENGTGNNLY
ncbi:MAG: hypothetical protein J5895_02550 [Alphaproteobacteria bacterium]|nr:hypothetical protein [Alphaproteobacteria bacterium]